MTRRVLAVLAAVALLVGACGGDDQAVAWRDLDLRLPAGWTVVNDQAGALYVADGAPGEEPGEPGDLEVGIQLSSESAPSSADWRLLVDDQGWTLERDESITVDDLPATLLEFSSDGSDGRPPTREQVVVVPSRDLVILSQAVTVQGQEDGPEVFDDHVDDFEAVRDSISFGAPEDFGG